MPRPVSVTSARVRPSSDAHLTVTDPPRSVNFTALVSRLIMICDTFSRSPAALTDDAQPPTASLTPFACACGASSASQVARISFIETASTT